MSRRGADSWEDVTRFVSCRAPGTKWRVDKAGLPPPEDFGMHESHGIPMGQVQDWRKPLGDERGLHVQDMGDHYSVHVDRYDPDSSPVRHILTDAPYVALGVALSIKVFGKTRLGFLGSALLGWGAGVLFMRNEVPPDSD